MQNKIYKVSELNSEVKSILDKTIGLSSLLIEGEVSNFRGNYASGHWYFSLKDNDSQISAVCFKWANQYFKFIPENGMEVICKANVSVYEKQGSYQLNVRHIEPKGVGAQALALEKLKEKLKDEGLFDISRKRSLPYLTQKIGIVTSPTGAAIKDVLKVIYRRSQNIEVLISPSRVQGEYAAQEMIKALERLYSIKDLDLIILTRGGGSKEDLWVFNDEMLARTIFSSPFPVISAVGHEIDITISDMVSDVRAATPSMAAELAVKEKQEIVAEVKNIKTRLDKSLINKLNLIDVQLDQYVSKLKYIVDMRLDNLDNRIKNFAGKLDSLSPLKVLARGYSLTYKVGSEQVITDSKSLKKGDKLKLKFFKGKTYCTVDS
ncbi:MAG: exodeoxyribonuclease VII large subunit [Candidatus Dadabacteria bacterium]|nr:exodeoxyribonuclease VII large subunit [Candidatus Dadabacteria bacterium]NIQ14411.1 exodeoxyribonuclease VII large subunit [Candidatus Dadabacteria bacterium]